MDAENAEVKTAALMIDGSTLIPERVIAMTYGDSAALPVSARRFGSLYATTVPTQNEPTTKKNVSRVNTDRKACGIVFLGPDIKSLEEKGA